jgi:hypothetical protein
MESTSRQGKEASMAKAITKGARASRRPDFWLLVDDDGGICTIGHDGTPAVFSGEEEAEIFRLFGARGNAWRTRQTSPGELVSLLYCRCAAAKRVCLDPTPELLCAAIAGLASTGKERFVERVVRLRGSPPLVAAPALPATVRPGLRK